MTSSHAARNLAQIELLRQGLTPRPTVGSGYRPSAWCHHCGETYDASLPCCPEEGCGQPQAAPVHTTAGGLCACADGGRIQPLLACRDCGGTGEVQ